jgi:hypothetical protein
MIIGRKGRLSPQVFLLVCLFVVFFANGLRIMVSLTEPQEQALNIASFSQATRVVGSPEQYALAAFDSFGCSAGDHYEDVFVVAVAAVVVGFFGFPAASAPRLRTLHECQHQCFPQLLTLMLTGLLALADVVSLLALLLALPVLLLLLLLLLHFLLPPLRQLQIVALSLPRIPTRTRC